MSNRLTFSLASLILIFAFVAMPVMGHDDIADDPNFSKHAKAGHMHPEVTVTIADADPTTPGIQVVDKAADTESDDLNATIQFDVIITVPIGSEAETDPVDGKDIGPTGLAYDSNFLPVGTGDGGVVARGTVENADSATPRMYTVPFTLTIAGDAIDTTITDSDAQTAARTASRAKAIADAIADGLMIDITVPANMIQTTGLVGGSTAGQANLESKTTVTVVAMSVDAPITNTVTEITSEGDDLTEPITFTIMFSEDTNLTTADLGVMGGSVVAGSLMAEDDNTMTWTVQVRAFGGETSVTLTVKDTVVASESSKKAPPEVVVMEETMLEAGDYLVVIRDGASPPFGNFNPDTVKWSEVSDEDEMPDLERLFDVGGSIQLEVEGATRLQVVFSEIMWAVDEHNVDNRAAYLGEQWIELHNRTSGDNAKNFAISDIKITTKEGRPALTEGTDRISNVVTGGKDWVLGKGQNGNSGSMQNGVIVGQKEFISMYRNNEGEPGHQDSRWTKSSELYATNHRGTPGAKERAGVPIYNPSGVALTVVFNEIANFPSDDKDYEWIELRTRSGDPNFENWRVHLVTGTDDRDKASETNPTQDELFTLPKLDTGRFDDILLVTATDPAKEPGHPLAAGYNVKVADADQAREGRDPNIRYVVADWKKELPNDGKFVLILRNGNDKTNHEKIQDLAGYHPNLEVNRANFYSALWPLIGYEAPNRTNNKIEDGQVARRVFDDIPGTKTKDGDKIDKVAFRHDNNGWTGIGYKRNTSPSAQHGGTPGYPNNAERSGNDAAALDAVIVTEVMPSQGTRNLSEWIELRNISDTIGVNVNGWRITIQNHDEDGSGGTFSGKLSEVITLSGNARIPPGQTLLIAARGGRDETNLPSDRIHIVGKKRTEVLINPYGFTIKVESKKDNNYHEVDMVGNLGKPESDRENAASLIPIAWEWPASANAEGDRVSIIRVSNKDTGALDGTMKDAWISFEGSAQEAGTLDKTYYGHSSDLGSPGHTLGGVLPVSLSKFRPERMKDTGAVVIRWITESELNNAGFNILRSEKRDGEFTKINTKLIAGQGTTSERTTYTYADTSAKPNVIYYYQIQDVSLDGNVTTLRTTHLRGNVTAAGKLTTTWGELKALQ